MNSQLNTIIEDGEILTSIVGLGSNLDSSKGTKLEVILEAVKALDEISLSPCIVSSFYKSEPVDCPPGSPEFINMVAALFLPAGSEAHEFFSFTQELEFRLGRSRSELVNEPRSIDIDLLFFGNRLISSDSLTIPHPRALERRFVLEPLSEIAPALVLPGQKFSVSQLLRELPKNGWVSKIQI